MTVPLEPDRLKNTCSRIKNTVVEETLPGLKMRRDLSQRPGEPRKLMRTIEVRKDQLTRRRWLKQLGAYWGKRRLFHLTEKTLHLFHIPG